MKLKAMPWRATQDGRVMVESSSKPWSTADGVANHFSILVLKNPWIVWKGIKIGHWEMNPPGWQVSNMLLRRSREIAPEGMKWLSQSGNNAQLWTCLVVKVKSDDVKKNAAREPEMLGPWIKKIGSGQQEMARVNTDILAVSELKWTGMGEFNSDDHYIYYCGQKSLRRNGVALTVNRSPKSGYILKNNRITDLCFQSKPFNITVIQVYAPTSNAKSMPQLVMPSLCPN